MRSIDRLQIAVLAVALAACGGSAGSDSSDAGPSDPVPPELRDIRVDIEGPLGLTAELNTGDVRHVLPGEGTAEVTAIARDDTTAVEDLTVEVVSDSGDPLAALESEVRNGLWRIRVQVAPGDQLRVRVTDEAGNQATGAHALIVPALSEAVVGAWEMWFVDDSMTVNHTYQIDWDAGSWSEIRQDSGLVRAGDWVIAGDLAQVSETTRSADPPDADPATVESRRDARMHIDALYMSLDPFYRMDAGTGLSGIWQRTWAIHEAGAGGGVELAEEGEETLTLTATDWTETRTITDPRGGSPSVTTATRAGTYRVEINDNYSEDVGDFLVRTVTTVEGAPMTESDTSELYVTRLDALLLTPMLRMAP